MEMFDRVESENGIKARVSAPPSRLAGAAAVLVARHMLLEDGSASDVVKIILPKPASISR
jgi:hypothetical protein